MLTNSGKDSLMLQFLQKNSNGNGFFVGDSALLYQALPQNLNGVSRIIYAFLGMALSYPPLYVSFLVFMHGTSPLRSVVAYKKKGD